VVVRVAHLGKYYPPAAGGIETHTQTLARAQVALGAQVRVVVVNHADAAGRDVTFDRFTPTRDATDNDGDIVVHRAGRVANVAKLDVCPTLPALLSRVRREFRPDVWHLHAPNVTGMLAVLADRRLRPLVVTHHSDIVRQKVLRHAVRPIEHAVYRRAARLLPTSPAYAVGSPTLAHFRDRVVPLPLGLDLTPFRTPSAAAVAHADRLRREHPGPLWLSVGRLIYYKALNVALDALRSTPGTLLVVGTGPMEAAWKQLATELGVGDRVRWLGRASDDELLGAYLASSALWFPSNARSEGFGLVQVEAMACGCPVINTDIPASGVSWVSRRDAEGLTVPMNDPAAFAAAARRLIEEPGLRDRLSAAARDRAEEFDWLTMGRGSLGVYESVIGRGVGR
jgi:glycosyltransferase involved in cell wall biosynthesis